MDFKQYFLSLPFKHASHYENWSQSRCIGGYQGVVLSAAIISPRALQTWHLSQKRSTNRTLIYSHLTAGKVINLSLDRFRRVNYNLEKQKPGMNNSYTYKTAHQLPGTFTAQLYSVLLAVKGEVEDVGRCTIGEMDARSKLVFTRQRSTVVARFIARVPSTQHSQPLSASFHVFKGLLCTVCCTMKTRLLTDVVRNKEGVGF